MFKMTSFTIQLEFLKCLEELAGLPFLSMWLSSRVVRPKMVEAAKPLKAKTKNWQSHLYHIVLVKASDMTSQIQREEKIPLDGRNSMPRQR